MNTKPKGVWIVTTVISLFAIVVGTYYSIRTKEQAENSNAAADVSLVFNTPNLSANINTTITPKITINPTTNQVTAVEVYITFDPSKVMVNSITNSGTFPMVLKAPVIDNNAGTASFIYGINGGPGIIPVPVTAVSDVATISITTKAIVGSTVISVANTSKVAEIGTDTSVLATFGQMTVNVQGTTTPSPSPTPTTYPAWDVDRNGIINIIDIGLISDNYGSSSPTTPRADVNSDGVINVVDIGIVVDHYQ